MNKQKWKTICVIKQENHLQAGDVHLWEIWHNKQLTDDNKANTILLVEGEMPLMINFRTRLMMDDQGDITVQALIEGK